MYYPKIILMKHFFVILISIMILHGCIEPNQTFKMIPPGIWQGVLLLDRQPVIKYGDDRDVVKKFDTDAELPFNFEVVYDNDSIFHLVIHNAEERIVVRDIAFGRDKATAKDTVIIDFPIYDTKIQAIYEDGVMEGDWIVNYKDNYRIPFKAVHGHADRFREISTQPAQIGGKWECTFEIGTKDEYKAVGIFKQEKEIVTGTFLTETGDYRYLEGKMVDKKLYLSAFDGAHAFLFLGKLMDDGSLAGTFRSGSKYTTNWTAKPNEKAKLASAYDLTKSNGQALNFSFPNESGKIVSIDDKAYNGKFKIIQIMGTWCPNCMDETVFLRDFFKANPDPEMAMISIGFERYKEEAKSLAALSRFKSRMDIKHEVLYGGYYDKKEALKSIPQLDTIMSYPTLLLVGKNNKIIKIHSGFSGPATPDYQNFVQEFKQLLTEVKGLNN